MHTGTAQVARCDRLRISCSIHCHIHSSTVPTSEQELSQAPEAKQTPVHEPQMLTLLCAAFGSKGGVLQKLRELGTCDDTKIVWLGMMIGPTAYPAVTACRSLAYKKCANVVYDIHDTVHLFCGCLHLTANAQQDHTLHPLHQCL